MEMLSQVFGGLLDLFMKGRGNTVFILGMLNIDKLKALFASRWQH